MSNAEYMISSSKLDLARFKKLIKDVKYEDKGILFSEMYFLWTCSKKFNISRIIESGRARGQSTLILAKIFPNKEIISIEHDQNSPDVNISHERLKSFSHVSLRFGDAIQLIPAIANSSDMVLIDGPKGFRGVRLALKLLSSGKHPVVFLHDTTKGTAERKFLEGNIKDILYSDNLPISTEVLELDKGKVQLPPELEIDGDKGYGFSLACIPYNADLNYKMVLFKAVVHGALNRWFKA